MAIQKNKSVMVECMLENTKMYSKTPACIYGFHGCSRETFEAVIYKNQPLSRSTNKYDWLGNGIYFWENSYQRASEWAISRYGEENAAVIGAFIDLGYCLDLTDYEFVPILKMGYSILESLSDVNGKEIPKNKRGKYSKDVLLRDLDCAVIEQIHLYNKEEGLISFDSVRGTFSEGEEVYPGSAFLDKTHTQVCIVNPNCIKGYFTPREVDENFQIP